MTIRKKELADSIIISLESRLSESAVSLRKINEAGDKSAKVLAKKLIKPYKKE